jgi:hypothetical protein
MMEAVSTSETPVNIHQNRAPNKPEDSHLHSRHRENLKHHIVPYWSRSLKTKRNRYSKEQISMVKFLLVAQWRPKQV